MRPKNWENSGKTIFGSFSPVLAEKRFLRHFSPVFEVGGRTDLGTDPARKRLDGPIILGTTQLLHLDKEATPGTPEPSRPPPHRSKGPRRPPPRPPGTGRRSRTNARRFRAIWGVKRVENPPKLARFGADGRSEHPAGSAHPRRTRWDHSGTAGGLDGEVRRSLERSPIVFDPASGYDDPPTHYERSVVPYGPLRTHQDHPNRSWGRQEGPGGGEATKQVRNPSSEAPQALRTTPKTRGDSSDPLAARRIKRGPQGGSGTNPQGGEGTAGGPEGIKATPLVRASASAEADPHEHLRTAISAKPVAKPTKTRRHPSEAPERSACEQLLSQAVPVHAHLVGRP